MKKFLIIILTILISSCSIHTVHNYDEKIYSKLIQIGLDKIDGKNPYLIRQSFQNEFYVNGDDLYKNKKYSLSLKITDSIGDWLIQKDSTILRKSLTVSANFNLTELKTHKIITSGNARSLIIFSESSSAWSSYISAEKAYQNAVRDVMKSIRIKLSLFLTQKNPINKNKNENHAKQNRKFS